MGCDVTVENDKVFMHGFKLPKYRCKGKGAPERLFQKRRVMIKKPAGQNKRRRRIMLFGPGADGAMCRFGLHGAASHVLMESTNVVCGVPMSVSPPSPRRCSALTTAS